MTKKKTPEKKKVKVAKNKITVRCRNCFMVDSYAYAEGETVCRHCKSAIFLLDAV